MGISNRLLGKKNVNGLPHIEAVRPSAALPGGEVRIIGSGLSPQELRRPRVRFGSVEGAVLISSDDFLVARVPAGASSGPVVVSTNGHASNPHEIRVAAPIAENLHPVTSPALDAEGNIYVTFSGSRGQKVQVGTCYRMQVFGDRSRNPDLVRITGMTIRRDNHRAGRCSRGHARHQEIIGTDEHCALNRTKTHARTPQFLWAQSATDDPYFASGKSGAGTHRLNVRKAIDILFPKQAIRDPHELKFPQLPW